MAKMKFYLNIEGTKLRTLDDLRENFFADAVLAHYQSGKLAQWLDVWNYDKELEQVRSIQATDIKGILAELCRIFDVEADLDDFEADISPEDYLAEKKEVAVQAEIQERIKAATSEVNMEFFEGLIVDDKDGSQRKALNAWLSLFPPLMVAITHGDAFVVKTLIQNGADVNVVVTDENFSFSALMIAVTAAEKPEIAKILIDAGADVNAKDELGRTALMFAVTFGNLEAVRALIQAGADVNAKDSSGWTALLYAVIKDNPNIEVIKALIEAGADVNAKDSSDWTVLLHAVRKDNPNIDVIKALVAAGADVNAKDSIDWTVLLHAVNTDTPNIEVIKTLIEAGADVNAKDGTDHTVLMHAVSKDTPNIEVIKTLIELGADIEAKDGFEATALMKAEKPEVIRVLVKAGAKVNARNIMGSTALMRAASADEPNIEVIKTLIEIGANVNAKDIVGRTALDEAEDDRVKAILRAAGGRSGN